MNEEIIRKGMRLRKASIMRLEVRAEVYDWLCSCSEEFQCGVAVLARGIIEDYFDKCKSSAPADDDKKSQ